MCTWLFFHLISQLKTENSDKVITIYVSLHTYSFGSTYNIRHSNIDYGPIDVSGTSSKIFKNSDNNLAFYENTPLFRIFMYINAYGNGF